MDARPCLGQAWASIMLEVRSPHDFSPKAISKRNPLGQPTKKRRNVGSTKHEARRSGLLKVETLLEQLWQWIALVAPQEMFAENRLAMNHFENTDDYAIGFQPYPMTARKRGGPLSRIASRILPGSVALAASVLFGYWTLYTRPPVPLGGESPAPRSPATIGVEAPAPGATTTVVASNPYGTLFDPGFATSTSPAPLMQSYPLEASLESVPPEPSDTTAEDVASVPTPATPRLAEGAPLPIPRPADVGPPGARNPFPPPGRRLAQQDRRAIVPATPSDNRSFFEKLFGVAQPPSPVLAYAAPEDGIVSRARGATSGPSPRYDRWTAVYDVAAHTVYLPNGTRLEAHSGLGNRLDDPRYVNERMRGATPPNIYQLQPREQLFHGVKALRLIPIGNGDLYGRNGLLAHTYMLGPNGDSNGCVSFRNYNAFLQAYENGEIRRLAVVSRLN